MPHEQIQNPSLPRPLPGRVAMSLGTAGTADGFFFMATLLLGLAASKSVYGVLPPAWLGTVDVLFICAFALSLIAVNSAIGLYARNAVASFDGAVARAVGSAVLDTAIFYLAIRAMTPVVPLRAGVPFSLLPYAFLAASLRPVLYVLGHAKIGQRRVLILGSGTDARTVQEHLMRALGGNIEVVGVLPAGPETSEAVGGVPVFERGTDLWDLVSRLKVREVIVAAREQRGGMLPLRALLECRIHGIQITDQTAYFERVHGEFPLESLKASWLIYGRGFEQNLRRRFAKRLTDVVASAVLLALAAPIMLATALAIRLEGPGPIIYRQERVGRGGRCFQVLKFRSMRSDAERDGVARWAGAGDARITRVGRFIRKTRIDELPQLLNVLRGQMSIVGPRPERPTFVDQLKRDVRFYDVRHSIKPGLTGWAQVRFNYAASIEDSRRKLQFDLYYVKNHTLALDLRILFETVRVVLRGEGAR
jgi:sugar transferase (PEP-CTERM system associated)